MLHERRGEPGGPALFRSLVGGPFGPAQVQTCNVGFPPDSGREPGRVLRTLWVVVALTVPRGAAPWGSPSSVAGPTGTGAGWHLRGGFPPGPGRGIQAFSRESPDAKSRGGGPPAPPGFRARSFPLARFGVAGRSGTVVGLFRNPSTCPDLGTFFCENAFQHIFSRKMRPKSVLGAQRK